MMTQAAADHTAPHREDLIDALMTAWAMERNAVHRTLSRTAEDQGISVEDLASSHVLELGFVASLLGAGEPQSVGV